eukprot:GAHX01000932.1.p1 GENE.GAHX01000932.1~~GAHX01000932.1.p1  ORF type:complete len:228 (-),score=58.19 GAHX01000932.1:30-674(-)
MKKDPFDYAKNLIRSKISQTNLLIQQIKTSSTLDDSSFNDVMSKIESIEKNILDLKKTIEIVEEKRSTYPGITDEILADRKKQLNRFKYINCQNKAEMSLLQKKYKIKQETTINYASGTSAQMSNKRQAQEVVIESMKNSINRLGMASKNIEQSLEGQSKIMDDFEVDMNKANVEMDVVGKRMTKLLGTPDRTTHGSVCILLLAIFVLFIGLFR